MTYIGVETVDRLRFFTCPARESRILHREGVAVKVPRGPVRQLVAVGQFLRRASSGLEGTSTARAAVLLPVPPNTTLLRGDYPSLFWHLERQILGPGKQAPGDMSHPTGEHAVSLVSETTARERWGLELAHPLAHLYPGEPQYLELNPGRTGGCEFKPIFYMSDLLGRGEAEEVEGNALYLPLSVTVALRDADKSVSQDPDERWLEIRRRGRTRLPSVGFGHRVYLANCGRVRHREDLRLAGWQLKRSAVEAAAFYESVDSGLLPEEACIGEVKSLVRLRPTQPINADLYL